MEGYYIKRIGQNKGKPRVWLEGMQASRAGFVPGQKYDIVVDGQAIVLQANPDGTRIVSSKREGEKLNPVIDINSRELLAIFDGMAAVRVIAKEGQIYLLPLASELKKQERYQRLKEKLEIGDPLTIGSLSHGGGILTNAIHAGLHGAGIRSELSFANDIREELLDHAASKNNAWGPRTKALAAPIQELAFDPEGLAGVPTVDIAELGLPCSGASKAGRSRRGLDMPESHPEVGHLVVAALVILNKCNAAIVIGENVPEYASSASAEILRHQLRDLGYTLHERMLTGSEWGMLENRTRWCFVAVTHGIDFDFEQLIASRSPPREVGEVLDQSIAPEDSRWRSFDYLKNKQVRDQEKGNGFAMQVVDATSTSVPTLRKGYAKGGSTDVLLQHPSDGDLLRQFTPEEHARIKEVPPALVAGLSATIAHQVLGQGILYPPFRDVGRHVGDALQRFAGRQPFERRSAEPDAHLDDHMQRVVADLKLSDGALDNQRGRYTGEVIGIVDGQVLQHIGRGKGVVHQGAALERVPALGSVVRVQYQRGRAQVQENSRAQLDLDL
jgi:DNA (cytosine-5)-methyltransferase 1